MTNLPPAKTSESVHVDEKPWHFSFKNSILAVFQSIFKFNQSKCQDVHDFSIINPNIFKRQL